MYVTRNEQFITDVRSPTAISSANGSSSLIEAKKHSDDTLGEILFPRNVNISAANKISLGLGAPLCTMNRSHEAPSQPVVAEDCYTLLYHMLVVPDLLDYKSWAGLYPSGQGFDFHYQNCAVTILGYTAASRDVFELIDAVLAVAQIVQSCVIDQEFSWGGTLDVGNGGFYVKVAG